MASKIWGRVAVGVALAGCGGGGDAPNDTTGGSSSPSSSVTPTADTGTPTAPVAAAVGHCTYVNLFSQDEECKEYRGDGWSLDAAEQDCAAPPFSAGPGTFVADAPCVYAATLGTCTIDEGTDDEVALVFPGDDPSLCSGVEFGCGLAGGDFVGDGACDGQTATGGEGFGSVPFEPFERVCVAEPSADDGEVCTWNAISGSTEEGYRFLDYGDCDVVRTQRPYVPYPAAQAAEDDSRLDDPVWAEEFAWVTDQFEASACVCCHSSTAPDGPAGWYLEDGPIWTDGASDAAIAMFAGFIDSSAFGAFPADDNHGFDRSTTGVPTTDIPRMQAFLEGELQRRGLSERDFADEGPWGGPLVDQLVYEPEACADGQGVDADGRVRWTGTDVRYLYVLEAGAANPTVPPNLDLPEGTLWRVDVLPEDAPMASGVAYGEVPADAVQAWPVQGAPEPLVSGKTYYLVALTDIIQPTTRCLFTAP